MSWYPGVLPPEPPAVCHPQQSSYPRVVLRPGKCGCCFLSPSFCAPLPCHRVPFLIVALLSPSYLHLPGCPKYECSSGSLGASGTWVESSPLSLTETGPDCPEGLSVSGRALFFQTLHTLWLSESRPWTLGKRKGPQQRKNEPLYSFWETFIESSQHPAPFPALPGLVLAP